MAKSDTQLVRESWALVIKAFTFDQVGALFYDILFAANPSLPSTIFKNVDTGRQAVRLIQMIDSAIKLLDRPTELVPVLVKLGERHAGYGTEEGHFAPVGAALIATLQKGLGDGFTPETAKAWVAIYSVIEQQMVIGMNNAEGQRQRKCGPYAARHQSLAVKSDEDWVRESWKLVMDKFGFEQFGLLFYHTLFEMDPSLPATLFKDVKDSAQAIQLIQMIDMAVKMLDRPIALAPVLIALGERHAGYGVTAAHMTAGGECLILSLRKGLGSALTKEMEIAWTKIYAVVNVCMSTGMNSERGQQLFQRYLVNNGLVPAPSVGLSFSQAVPFIAVGAVAAALLLAKLAH